jgi:hypothetical protein
LLRHCAACASSSALDRFQFDDERPLDQQVDVMRLDDHPIFCDSDFMLLHDIQPTLAQLVQRVLIDLFQKTQRQAYSKLEKLRQ